MNKNNNIQVLFILWVTFCRFSLPNRSLNLNWLFFDNTPCLISNNQMVSLGIYVTLLQLINHSLFKYLEIH